jgi:hypothetical protein
MYEKAITPLNKLILYNINVVISPCQEKREEKKKKLIQKRNFMRLSSEICHSVFIWLFISRRVFSSCLFILFVWDSLFFYYMYYISRMSCVLSPPTDFPCEQQKSCNEIFFFLFFSADIHSVSLCVYIIYPNIE